MKKIISFFIAVLLFQIAICQNKNVQLYVGDNASALQFSRMIQHASPILELRELKGKTTILDFWNSSCSFCISYMPHLQQLQDHFGDSLQIILVNSLERDSEEKVRKIISRVKQNSGYSINLPIALYDSTVLKNFPHIGEPFEVVIDRNGNIIATTFFDEINEDNIRKVIRGEKVSFPVKSDFFDTNLPEVMNKSANGTIISYSAFIKNVKEGYTGPKYNDKNEMIGVSYSGSLLDVYQLAYRFEVFFDSPVVEYVSNDSLFFNVPGTMTPPLIQYDFICPPAKYSQDYFDRSLKQDLYKAFGFSLKRTLKDTNCLVFKTNQFIKKNYSKNLSTEGNLEYIVSASKNRLAVFQNSVSVATLLGWWRLGFSRDVPDDYKFAKLIDETDDKHLIDIKFPVGFDFSDFENLRKYLHSKGIDLSIEKRSIPVVIMADKQPGEPTIL